MGDGEDTGNNSSHSHECPAHILNYLASALGPNSMENVKIFSARSAQQQVWIISKLNPTSTYQSEEWKDALASGNKYLAVRQWKTSSCWWNLNRNQYEKNDIDTLAKSEVAGYRLARKALLKIHIPLVLYFSHDDDTEDEISRNDINDTQQLPKPWAILSYVGPSSIYFDNNVEISEYWMNRMVKTRLEFGSEEPHPRWGRVPVDQAVEYTLSVLRNVTIPLHSYMRDNAVDQNIISCLQGAAPPATAQCIQLSTGYTYSRMVRVYQSALQEMKDAHNTTGDEKLHAAIGVLEKAIAHLTKQQPYLETHSLPAVLCHMDCQPQNLLFAQSPATDVTPRISSVLDWEEAAFADPRFELLLMCRKVCANRAQAEQIWTTYQQECPQPLLGPLEPWLALETVHSITSLLLQTMDLLGGGRNPWETKPDLWGKIQREIRRLVTEYGWDFCDAPEFR